MKEVLGKYEPEFDKHLPSNFTDITANLLSVANLVSSKGHKKEVEIYIGHVRQYLKLLDDFPEFRQHELTHDDPKIGGSSVKYIKQKYEELRKESYK